MIKTSFVELPTTKSQTGFLFSYSFGANIAIQKQFYLDMIKHETLQDLSKLYSDLYGYKPKRVKANMFGYKLKDF